MSIGVNSDIGKDVKQWYDFFVSEGYFGYKEFNGKLVPKHLSEATIIDFIEAKDKIQNDVR
ncbi:MAG: hypothetical protein IPJ03_16810 [Ignavibacteriales bacterium]|nr:hypothetical protein [Ignavibacteriales bacterium]